jgi:hypothetical protein
MSVIEKIDAEIAKHYLIINDKEHYSFSTVDYYETKVETLEEIKEIILSEKKEPCDYCGSLAALYQISTNGNPDYQYYEPKYCPECGRPLNL